VPKSFREVFTRDNLEECHNVRIVRPKFETTYERVMNYLDNRNNSKVRVWKIKS